MTFKKNYSNSKLLIDTLSPSPLERVGERSHISWKPGTMIYPLPAALISCGSTPEEYNMLTLSWMGTICSNPPMCYISVRPERHSYDIIKKSGEFVINLTNEDMAYATD